MRGGRAAVTAWALWSVASLASGCADDTAGAGAGGICGAPGAPPVTLWSGPEGAETGRWLAVVGTDYQSTEVSIVDLEAMEVRASAVLHSGSRVTCIGTALSGDVVLGRTPAGDGTFLLIDRATSVLTRVSRAGVLGQIAVGGGFFANPQDAVVLPDGAVVVSRAQGEPETGEAGGGQGQDLLAVDGRSGQVRWRAPLAGRSTLSGGHAWPGRMALQGGEIWVPLASVSRDFAAMGPGRLVAVDPGTGAIRRVVDAPDSKNCTAARGAGGQAVVAVCSGFFKEGAAGRAAFSNVIGLTPAAGGTTPQVLAQAGEATEGRGFGFEIAPLDAKRGWVIADGDLDAGLPDALWAYDAGAQALQRVARASAAFAMTSLYLDRARGRLWVTDREAAGGDLSVFDVSGPGAAKLLKRLDSNPGGLRATEIAGF